MGTTGNFIIMNVDMPVQHSELLVILLVKLAVAAFFAIVFVAYLAVVGWRKT